MILLDDPSSLCNYRFDFNEPKILIFIVNMETLGADIISLKCFEDCFILLIEERRDELEESFRSFTLRPMTGI